MAYLNHKILNRFRHIEDVVKHYNYVSFDVFDTLIIRKCGNPHNIFDIVENVFNEGHYEDDKIQNFRQIRIEAEANARKATKNEEVTLEDIVNEMPFNVQIKDELKLLEERIELEQCVGRTDVVQLFNKCKDEGKKVCITSDMYLREDVIIEILRKNNIKDPDYLFLSSNVMRTKRSGSLFHDLTNTLGVNSNRILHIGDNIISDFVRPISKGISAYWINRV